MAYPTFDTVATVRFYTEVMGFRLVDAVHDESGPRAFLHTFFAMESGEIIAFFDIPGLEKPKRDGLPPRVRHLALSVDSAETLAALESASRVARSAGHRPCRSRRGVVVDLFHFHFTDPNAVTLELTYQARALNDVDAAGALEMVARWTARNSSAG